MPRTPDGTEPATPSAKPGAPQRDARGRFLKQSVANEIAASKTALESAHHDLEGARTALAERERELAERERELAALRAELGALRTEFAGLRADSALASEGRLSLQTLQVDLASRDRRVADLEDQLLESRQRIAALEERPKADDGPSAEALERSVDLVRQTLKESLQSLREREDQASGLEARLATTERMLEERVRELDATRAQLANARETVGMREEEIVILRGSASRAQKSVAARDAELATANGRIDELRQDLGARDDQISRLRDGLAAAERAAKVAESEADALRKRVDAHAADAERHAEEQRRSQDALAAVKETLDARDQEIAALQRIQSVAEGRLADQELEAQELEARLEAETQTATDARRTATIAIEEQEALARELAESERERQRLATSLASVQRIIANVGAEAAVDATAAVDTATEPLETAIEDPASRAEAAPNAGPSEAAEGWTSVRTETGETREPSEAAEGWSQPVVSADEAVSTAWGEAGSAASEAPVSTEPEPPAEEAFVAELLPPSTADTYWEGRHLSDKLAPLGASDRISFFARHIERVCQEGDRTVRVLSIGGVPHFEVRLARRLVDGGCKQFKIRLLVGSEAAAARERTAAEAEGVAGNLELRVGTSPQGEAQPEPQFDVVFVPGDIARLSRIEERIEAWKRWLSPGGVCVVASSIGEAGARRGEAATTVAQRIFEVMPGRYKHDHVSGAPKSQLDTALDAGSSDGPTRASAVLPALLDSGFEFETFVAFGGVGDLFFGPSFGPNFDPTQASDRRFVDRLVRLDDDKIEAGVLKPVRMLAALRNEPVESPTIPNGWTPEFCLAPAKGAEARSDQASAASAASTISLNDS